MCFSRSRSVIVVLLSLGALSAFPQVTLGQDCSQAKDWKDIYILPTNPRPDSNIKISLNADKKEVQPGDLISLTFQADRDCYLSIMDMGTSGRIVRLWPNDYSKGENKVQANVPRTFPGQQDGFRYRIAGPSGVERIIAYATSERGKILSEQEFQQLQNTAFKQFVGGAKDLAIEFQRSADSLPPSVSWGTTQINVCIGSGPPPEPLSAGPKETYVLALGVPTGKLKWSKRDAQRFVDTLIQKMGVKESNVRLVLGSEATYDGFVSGMEWLASKAQPEDTAVVYFSGHGSQVPDQPPLDEADGLDECFVVWHTQKPSNWREALAQKALLVDDDFNILMKKISARKKILVADTCHSGTINKEAGLEVGDFVSKYYPLRDPDTGKEMWPLKAKSAPTNYGNDNEALLSACLDNESALESPSLRASVFTEYLIRAINEGSSDLEQAFETAKKKVVKYVEEGMRRNNKIGAQTPYLTDPHGLVKTIRFGK